MIFAKLDTCFWWHDKFVEAGEAAAGYWAGALAFLRHSESSNGVLLDRNVGRILNVGVSRGQRHCKRLVECGLFARRNNGWELLGYAEKNETKEDIQARLQKNSSRVAASRKKKALREGQVAGSSQDPQLTIPGTWDECNALPPDSDSDSVPQEDLDRNKVPDSHTRVRAAAPSGKGVAADLGVFGAELQAWIVGVRSVLGVYTERPWSDGPKWLVPAARAHAHGLTGQPLLDWFTREGATFAREYDGHYGGYTPQRFVVWLDSRNAKRLVARGRLTGIKQSFDPNAPWLADARACTGPPA